MALNEVRVISNSIMTNKGRLLPDKTIKLDPEKSVLKYTVGEKIKVKKVDFERLAAAFF
jgi:hypothetical protein